MLQNNRKIKPKLIVLILLFAVSTTMIYPQEVYARNFFQRLGRGIRKTVTFIVKLPDKSTRWMGPVLGPIAANVLTANLAQSSKIGKIFIKAHKAQNVLNNIDEQRKLVKELKSAYKDQAKELEDIAAQIRQQRKDLASELTKGDIEFDDYMQKAVALEKLAQSYDAVAGEFYSKSDRINEGTIIKIVTNNALKVLADKVKSAVAFELKNEISKMIRQDVISKLLGNKLANSDLVIDMLVDDDISEFLKAGGNENFDIDELKRRLRERIKELARESRDDLRKNWREKIKEAIAELSQQMKEEKSELSSPPQKDSEKDTSLDEILDESDSGSKCSSGYEWDNKVGKCKQSNCNDIDNAHWSYTVDCVCGSSGSVNENPKDPNKECAYSKSYESCPGCVYECVHLDEDCPLEGIGGY